MANSLINWVLTYPKRFILFILLITLAAGCFVYKNISINTSNTDLLSKELTFRKNDIAFTKEFPQFSNTIMVVIDAREKDVAQDIASKFYYFAKTREDELFDDIFYPNELDFFKKNGFLYLSEDELEESLDEMSAYQPFISRLSQNQTLYGLLNTVNLFLTADLNDQYIQKINKLFKKLPEVESNNSLSWSNLFSSRSEINHREIIYLKPKLNTGSFFPSKDSLNFLKNIDREFDDYKHANRMNMYQKDSKKSFDIRLTGTVPMEQEELSNLEKGSKKGIFISLLFVLIIISIAFFWRMHLILGSLATLIIGLIWTTAIALLLFQELNLISIAFAVLFIGLGIDFAIHYCLRSVELFDEKHDNFLINTHKSISKALFLTAIAIAIGFFSFAFTSFKGVAQLGAIAGSGMFVSLFLTLFFLPAFLILKKNKETFSGWSGFEKMIFFSFFNNKRISKIFFYLSLALILGSIYNLEKIQFENDPIKLRDQNTTSVQTMNELIKDKNVNPHSVDILVDNFSEVNDIKNNIVNSDEIKEAISFFDLIPENQEKKLEILDQFKTFYPKIELKEPRLLTPREFALEKTKINDLLSDLQIKISKNYKNKIDIREIKRLEKRINSYEYSESFTEYEKQFFYFLNQNIKRFNKSLEAKIIFEEDIPVSLKKRYIGQNGKIRVEIVPSKDLDNFDYKKSFIASVSNINLNISGGSFTTYEAGKEVVKSFKEAIVASIFLTTLFLIFTLRNFKKVFIVFVNLIAAFLFTLYFLGALGINLNFANIIALPLLFGFGAATSIQTVLRTEEFNNLENYFEKSSTPSAVVFSLLTTLGAFFVLSLSSHVGTSSMGILLIISLFSVFLANLTVLIPLEKYLFKK